MRNKLEYLAIAVFAFSMCIFFYSLFTLADEKQRAYDTGYEEGMDEVVKVLNKALKEELGPDSDVLVILSKVKEDLKDNHNLDVLGFM